MKPWSEDNYLERLMPQLQQAKHVSMESCPDSDLLAAYAEDQVTAFVRGAITAHLAHCSECSDILTRLESFSRASVPDQDREWVNAEKRLDNWAESFLASRAAQNPAQAAPASQVLTWKDAPRAAFAWWKLGWAAGGVAVLGLVVGGLLVTKNRSSLAWFQKSQPPQRVAVQQTPTPATAEITSPVAATPAPAATQSAAAAPVKSGVESEHLLIARNAVHPASPAPRPQTAHQVPTAPDASSTPSSATPTSAQDSGEVAQVQSAPESTPSAAAPSATTPDASTQTASAAAVAQPQHTATQTGSAASPAIRTVTEHYAAANTTAARPRPPANLPTSLQFDAGSRLFIRVTSISRQPDGSFTFQGSLLQPAAMSGGKTLDIGTVLNGSGTEKDGKLTAFVRNFVLQGVSYSVSGASGPVLEQMPGAGKAVKFEDGRLEMWLSLASTYQKAR